MLFRRTTGGKSKCACVAYPANDERQEFRHGILSVDDLIHRLFNADH